MSAGLAQVCQSCGEELSTANLGTEANGDASNEFCAGCYSEGRFTNPSATLGTMESRLQRSLTDAGEPLGVVAHRVFGLRNLKRWRQ